MTHLLVVWSHLAEHPKSVPSALSWARLRLVLTNAVLLLPVPRSPRAKPWPLGKPAGRFCLTCSPGESQHQDWAFLCPGPDPRSPTAPRFPSSPGPSPGHCPLPAPDHHHHWLSLFLPWTLRPSVTAALIVVPSPRLRGQWPGRAPGRLSAQHGTCTHTLGSPFTHTPGRAGRGVPPPAPEPLKNLQVEVRGGALRAARAQRQRSRPGDGLQQGPCQAVTGPTEGVAVRGDMVGLTHRSERAGQDGQAHGATLCSCEGEASPATPPGPMGTAARARVPGWGKRGCRNVVGAGEPPPEGQWPDTESSSGSLGTWVTLAPGRLQRPQLLSTEGHKRWRWPCC